MLASPDARGRLAFEQTYTIWTAPLSLLLPPPLTRTIFTLNPAHYKLPPTCGQATGHRPLTIGESCRHVAAE